MPQCDRCGQTTTVTTMSFFNTETICMLCMRREKAHPDYARAHATDTNAVRRGEYNFKGIGCPPELYHPDTTS